MMLIPHWHSTVFPILFWFGNLFAGTAALIIFPAVLGRASSSGSHFGPDQIPDLLLPFELLARFLVLAALEEAAAVV